MWFPRPHRPACQDGALVDTVSQADSNPGLGRTLLKLMPIHTPRPQNSPSWCSRTDASSAVVLAWSSVWADCEDGGLDHLDV